MSAVASNKINLVLPHLGHNLRGSVSERGSAAGSIIGSCLAGGSFEEC